LEHLEWDDITESAPAIVTALAVPLTYSIADGIGLGFITFSAVKVLSGRGRQCPPAVYAIALVFMIKFGLLA
ncbi:MAG: NCS2 family permease, partial [Thioalkalivibrio sp.]|nr:NCS2 family permease [Thioalkalivibrio sp.]